MEKIAALWNLFRKGECVSNPAAWKNGGISVASLALFFLAIQQVSAAFGHPLPIDEKTADGLAAGVLGVVHIVLAYTTSDKIGVLPAKQSSVPPDSGTPIQRISQSDMQAGIDFANQANSRRGQNIE